MTGVEWGGRGVSWGRVSGGQDRSERRLDATKAPTEVGAQLPELNTVAPCAMEHRLELDGVRGLAVALVVLAHARIGPFHGGGWSGLVLFFALSGYLITTNLLQERNRTGGVKLGRFYVRRARRLFPALFAMLAAVVALGWVGVGDAAWSATYLGNWVRAFDVADLGMIGHTWSLAIEEQFYLVMPLLVASLSVRRLRTVLVVAATLVMVWRPALWLATGDSDRLQFGFDTRADAIILGCVLALGVFRPGRALTVAAAVALGWVSVTDSPAPYTVGLTVAALASVVVVAHAATTRSGLGHPVLAWLGTRSYGIYLWHAPLIWRADLVGRTPAVTVLVLAMTGLLAEGSYRFIEQPLRSRTPAA